MFEWVKKDLYEFGNYLHQNSYSAKQEDLNYDIAFIGAGLASTHTLIELINNINYRDSSNIFDGKLKIAVFEKDEWVWGGIPYGRRSSFTSLIITPLDEFLPDYELEPFINWMCINYQWLIKPFIENAGSRSKKWLKESENKILQKESHNIHIPRYFFGIYLWDKLRKSFSESSNNIEINFISEEVSSIEKTSERDCRFTLKANNLNYFTNNIMLGVGIPEIRTLKIDSVSKCESLIIQDPYYPQLSSQIENIKSHVTSIENPKVMIVGANASALEIIYQIQNNLEKTEDITFKVLSPQGKLPNLFIKNKPTSFEAKSLNQLDNTNQAITADSILEAFKKDLQFADLNNYGISDTLPIFTSFVGSLVGKLSDDEKLKFVTFHGVEIGRLQRRAGYEYTLPVNELIEKELIEIISGKLVEITIDKNHEGKANYISEGELCCEKFDVLINCSGSSGLDKKHLSNLLIQLIESKICKSTPSSHGFVVGDKFDVCDGFYINGPLLAGNVVGSMGIWHVEHCGRIMSFSKKISGYLIDSILK